MTTVPLSVADARPLRAGRYGTRLQDAPFAQPLALTRVEPACWLLLAAAALCGGLSVYGWRDALLAVIALPALLLALWPQRERTPARPLIMLAFGASLLPLVYLIPLPAEWVLRLPGRATLLQPALTELGGGSWLPASLAPDATWQAWLKTIPPLALFVAALRLHEAARRRLLAALLLLAALQAIWALLQLPAGADERLYLYASDGASRGGGAFANRSHLAGLLAMLLPVWAMFPLPHGQRRDAFLPRALAVAGVLLLVAAILATRSRAGACLLVIEGAALASWALYRRHARSVLFALAAVALAGIVILPSAGPSLLQGFTLDLADGRAALLQRSFAAAMTFFPLGSGPGTFASVFATFDTTATLDTVFVNHAHDEPVQLLFELGATGAALFAGGVAATAYVLARHPNDALRWGCALGVAAALLHSLVDYPLRVPLTALACAALAACALAPRRKT